jgi:Tol biopolymer transport system component
MEGSANRTDSLPAEDKVTYRRMLRPCTLLALTAWVTAACGSDRRAVAYAQESATGGDPEVVATRLADLLAEDMWYVRPSQDGRVRVFTKWPPNGPGTMYAQDLTSGAVRRLSRETAQDQYATPGLLSQDGQRVAYTAYLGRPSFHYEIRVVSTDGSGERTLVSIGDSTAVAWMELLDWHPDGQSLLAMQWSQDGSADLVSMSAQDASRRVLRSFGWQYAVGARYTPDGRHIAYDRAPDESSADRELYLLDADGRRETRLTQDGGEKEVIGWSRSGEALYYAVLSSTNEHSVASVWRLPMRGARAAGAATLIRADIARAGEFQVAGGRIYYRVLQNELPLWTMMVDVETARVVTTAVPMLPSVSGGVGARSGTAVMDDGTTFRYFRQQRQRAEVVLRETTTGKERLIPLPLSNIDGHVPAGVGAIIVRGSERGKPVLVRADLQSGQVVAIAAGELDYMFEGSLHRGQFSPDGSVHYRVRDVAGGGSQITAHHLSTGEMRVVQPEPCTRPAVNASPDGSWVAYLCERASTPDDVVELRVVPSTGGESRLLHAAARPGYIASLLTDGSWSTDGRYLVFRENVTAEPQNLSRIWRVDVTTGQKALLVERPDVASYVRLHSDNRRLTFFARADERLRELWMLDNLPEARSAATSHR